MTDQGGALPQRPKRQRRRHAAAPAEESAAPSGETEEAFNTAADRPDAAPDSGPAAYSPTVGPALESISDKHSTAALRSAKVDGYDFEYLDHTADIQLHAWGATLERAFEQVALAMFNYMTPLSGISDRETKEYEASGHDMHSMLFAFLDELLFVFSTELFVPAALHIAELDRSEWRVKFSGKGEVFDRQRHASGTEVKAITYSAMDVREQGADVEIFVIVDI